MDAGAGGVTAGLEEVEAADGIGVDDPADDVRVAVVIVATDATIGGAVVAGNLDGRTIDGFIVGAGSPRSSASSVAENSDISTSSTLFFSSSVIFNADILFSIGKRHKTAEL